MPPKDEKTIDGSLAFITSSGLRGKQSVRATFKLSATCIEAISIVAAQLGIKQKSLFDHLAQDSDSLNAIAREVQNARVKVENRVQKTMSSADNPYLCWMKSHGHSTPPAMHW